MFKNQQSTNDVLNRRTTKFVNQETKKTVKSYFLTNFLVTNKL